MRCSFVMVRVPARALTLGAVLAAAGGSGAPAPLTSAPSPSAVMAQAKSLPVLGID
jgi:hypothetical protein